MRQIRVVNIGSNSARGRGLEHGRSLAPQILSNITLYRSQLTQSESELSSQIQLFSAKIKEFSQEYFEEIEGIAEGAGVLVEDIVLLNSRTELLSLSDAAPLSECFVFFFSQTGLLCQNWDWWEKSAENVALLQIKYTDGRSVAAFTEAGMLGKFGLSSAGFGTAFNYLYPDSKTAGLPVHILLRAALDAHSFEDASELLRSEHAGTAGNILLASSDGLALDFELSGERTSAIPLTSSLIMHTNHYLGGTENHVSASEGFLANSVARYTQAVALSDTFSTYGAMEAKAFLADRAGGEGMLCRSFKAEDPGEEPAGTVASVIMDLKNRTIEIALLPQENAVYSKFDRTA